MRIERILLAAALLASALPALASRQWIVYTDANTLQGTGWYYEPSGDADGRGYYWFYGYAGKIERAFYDITTQQCFPVAPNTDPFPVKPGLYAVEQWAPSARPAGLTDWMGYLVIEASFDGPGATEEATDNQLIPWRGAYGTNHQWIQAPLGTHTGAWVACGPGPHCPESNVCDAGQNTAQSLQMWMKRGSTLYFKFDQPWEMIHPATALRLTEIYSDPATCGGSPSPDGRVDLRCIGNADPIYYSGEPFANDDQRTQQTCAIDGENAFAVQGYAAMLCLTPVFPYNEPLVPGLPGDGLYTAQLADHNVTFQLRYDGFNSLKWRSHDTGEFAEDRVFTLAGGQEFTPGHYSNIYLLTASASGANGHKLNIEAVYDDATTQTVQANLYDWSNQDGDANNVAVGVDGKRRSLGTTLGFRRLSKWGDSILNGSGGTTDNSFVIAHTLSINPCKTLTEVRISTAFMPQTFTECRTGGQNVGDVTINGAWTNETVKSTAENTTAGIGSLSAPAGSAASVVFSFTPSISTTYKVQATWAEGLTACTQAAFVVTQDGTPVTVFKDQQSSGNGWQSLAEVPMTAGNTYTVTLDAALSTGGPAVYADAVRWEPPGINANVLAASLETAGATLCCPQPWADADGDQDVDMLDFAKMQSCLTPSGSTIPPGCECFEVTDDQVIDINDLNKFAACAMGPEVKFEHSATAPFWPNWPDLCPKEPAN